MAKSHAGAWSVVRAMLLALGRSVIVSYTNRERHRLEPYLEPYRSTRQRAFYPFFRLTGFGFTVAQLVPPSKANR